MKKINWNIEKARILQTDLSRGGVSFEDCVIAMENGDILDIIDNPTREHQKMFILKINEYAYIVPFVEDEEQIFLKTVYPSRKHTALYL